MKTVLVTGSAKGIGKACILKFAKEGYNVIIHYNHGEKEAISLKQQIDNTYNVVSLLIKCDLTNEEEIINMINIIKNKFNTLDILINNASFSSDNYIEEKTKEEFMKVLEVNTVAPFLLVKYAKNIMPKGYIINISSTDSVDTYSTINIDYCASKAALNSLTQTLSLALPNLKIISILPNWVETESILEMNKDYLNSELKRIGQKRLQKPFEVADIIYQIINNKTTKTGSIIRIDGDVM